MAYSYVIAGAGLSGSTLARCMAEKGKEVLVVERRSEIGGNLTDEKDETGILVQKYGPHIFHTNDEEVYTFITNYAPLIGKTIIAIPIIQLTCMRLRKKPSKKLFNSILMLTDYVM